jgi:hypothetical protein
VRFKLFRARIKIAGTPHSHLAGNKLHAHDCMNCPSSTHSAIDTMDSANQPEAGPSTLPALKMTRTKSKPSRKPKSAHPDQPRHPKRSLPPPLPKPPTNPSRPGGTTATHPHLPIKVLQGVGTRRTDSTKQGFGKEVIFVTRKTGLGAFIGRCRSLVVDEG